jgi:hypothetical protein
MSISDSPKQQPVQLNDGGVWAEISRQSNAPGQTVKVADSTPPKPPWRPDYGKPKPFEFDGWPPPPVPILPPTTPEKT